METRLLLPLARGLLTKAVIQRNPRAAHLRKACGNLQRAYQCMSAEVCRYQDLGKAPRRCVEYSVLAKVNLIPKFHLSQHLAEVSQRAGNPKHLAVYLNEDHNRNAVKTAIAASVYKTERFSDHAPLIIDYGYPF
jgi:hypothetical protein